MKLNLVFATATAVGLLMTGSGAYAAGANTLYITQSGGGNEATVQQDKGTGGNDVGLAAAPVLQSGDNNRFSELQFTGSGGSYGNNDIVELHQIGDGNTFTSSYNGGAGNNLISKAIQSGDLNWASIWRNSSTSGTISTFKQLGNSNSAKIDQTGTYNTVTLLKEDGNGNGGPYGSGGPQNSNQWGIWATQSGYDNLLTEASITGKNNNNSNTPGVTSSGDPGPVRIIQNGDYNGLSNSVARINGSNGNAIFVDEEGNWNNFSVKQGTNGHSTQDWATLTQTGNYNSASITQFGSYNLLHATQTGDSNDMTAHFSGDSNGAGSLTLIAAALVTANPTLLSEGTISQDSTGSLIGGNHVDYNVTGDSNLFAMAQIGGNNHITGTVNSNSNQVAILQTGSSNVTTFTQTGGNNNSISVNQ